MPALLSGFPTRWDRFDGWTYTCSGLYWVVASCRRQYQEADISPSYPINQNHETVSPPGLLEREYCMETVCPSPLYLHQCIGIRQTEAVTTVSSFCCWAVFSWGRSTGVHGIRSMMELTSKNLEVVVKVLKENIAKEVKNTDS